MSLENLVQGCYGIPVEVTVQEDGAAMDISAYTTLEIVLRAERGTAKTRTAAFKTDGTDGVITYALADGDLDAGGKWFLQAHLAKAGEELWSEPPVEFAVGRQL